MATVPGGLARLWGRRTAWAPAQLARITAVVGLLMIATEAIPHSNRPVELDLLMGVLPPFAPHATRPLTIAAGTTLLLLAGGLRRRKRRAWLVVMAITVGVTVLHLLRTREPEVILLGVGLLTLLWSTRKAFTGVADPRSRRHTLTVLVASTVMAALVGLAVVLLDPDGRTGPDGALAVLQQVAYGLVGLRGPIRFVDGQQAMYEGTTLALLGAVAVVTTLASLLRAPSGPAALTERDEARLRELLGTRGSDDSLGYFSLRRDKSVVFSPTGKAAVCYRVVTGVSLAAGDPVGDPEAWPGAIEAWLLEARRYAWVTGVLGASERGAQAYRRHGLRVLELGDEAVVEVDRFSLSGRSMRGVRQAVGRARRLGYSTTVSAVSVLSDEELQDARAGAARWREGGHERGFAMALGRLGDPDDPECVLVRCRDAEGRLCALLHLVPWGDDGLSLDLMRRSPQCDNGVVELMVHDLVAAAPRRGVTRISLNFAVFRSVFERGDRLGAGPVIKASRGLLVFASRFWQLESLYRSNAKYQPLWVPRFICFEAGGDLARISMAAMEAEAFIVRPRLLRWGAARRLPEPTRERVPLLEGGR
jgi:lysyl-tRNA synthetase class 2